MPTFSIKKNDRRPVLRVQLQRDDNSVVDLTTATEVRLKVDAPLSINGVCDIITASQGIVEYVWQAGDVDVEGQHKAEFEVTWPVGIPETFPSRGYLIVQVEKDLG